MATKGSFNTGRLYTAKGQRIAWVYVCGIIIFVDVDRGISGEFPVLFGNTDLIDNKFVLNQYDALQYTDRTHNATVKELEKIALAL